MRPSATARDRVAGLATSPKKTDPEVVGQGVVGVRGMSHSHP
jgi:hypothetical protein